MPMSGISIMPMIGAGTHISVMPMIGAGTLCTLCNTHLRTQVIAHVQCQGTATGTIVHSPAFTLMSHSRTLMFGSRLELRLGSTSYSQARLAQSGSHGHESLSISIVLVGHQLSGNSTHTCTTALMHVQLYCRDSPWAAT